MDDKYMSKLSPTVDLWAGIYLVVIGKYSKLFYYQLELYRFYWKCAKRQLRKLTSLSSQLFLALGRPPAASHHLFQLQICT